MQRYLCFSVADLLLALQVDLVAEVASVPPITRIPRPAPHIEGLVAQRGRTIPVVDLRKRLGLVNPVIDHDTRMIVAFPGPQADPIGFIVDSVSEILSVGEAQGTASVSVPWVEGNVLTGVLEIQCQQVLVPDLAKIADLRGYAPKTGATPTSDFEGRIP
jgi:purine-binding chemotaxis protein CheW